MQAADKELVKQAIKESVKEALEEYFKRPAPPIDPGYIPKTNAVGKTFTPKHTNNDKEMK